MNRHPFATLIVALAATCAAAADAPPLNTRTALPGYFVVGGLGVANRTVVAISHPIDQEMPPNQLVLLAVPSEPKPFGEYNGFSVFLGNSTGCDIVLSSVDGHLPIVRQAKDENGRWRPIEYLVTSRCGNSYVGRLLPAGHYWTFVAPEYTGSFRTTMRFALNPEGHPIYSNEFEGAINPGQFDGQVIIGGVTNVTP